MSKSNRKISYECTGCGLNFSRSLLHSKRVQFVTMGEGGQVLRSRVTAWLCGACMEADPDYDRPKFAASPGMADTRIAVKRPVRPPLRPDPVKVRGHSGSSN